VAGSAARFAGLSNNSGSVKHYAGKIWKKYWQLFKTAGIHMDLWTFFQKNG